MTYQKGSAQALANPAKSKTKIQESLTQYYQKNVSVKDQSVFIGDIRVSFFDLWPCRRLGTQRQHGINYISDNKVVHQPAAMDKNLNTDCGEHGFDFFTDFFLKPVFFGFIYGFPWIREHKCSLFLNN